MQAVRGKPEELAHTTQELRDLAGQLLDRYLAYLRSGGEGIVPPDRVVSALLTATGTVSDTRGTTPQERRDRIVEYLLLVLEGKSRLSEERLNELDELIPKPVQQPVTPVQVPVQAPPVQPLPVEEPAEQQAVPSGGRSVSERVMDDARDAANAFIGMAIGMEGWQQCSQDLRRTLEMYRGMQLVGTDESIRKAQQFLELFISSIPSAYKNVVGAYVNDSPSTRQDLSYEDLLDMVGKISGILRDAERNATGMEERYGAGLVAAVLAVKPEMNRLLFMETASAALNPMMLADASFEPRRWLAHIFSEYGATETGSGGTPAYNDVFLQYMAVLDAIRADVGAQGNVVEAQDEAERRARTIRMLENSYHVDLSQLDDAAKGRIADRIRVFAGILHDMATYLSTDGTVNYDTFVKNMENAGIAMREMFSALSASQDSTQLLRGIGQVRAGLRGQSGVEAFNGLRPEAYGRLVDYAIDTQVLGTYFLGQEEGEAAVTPRSVIAAELGIPYAPGMRGAEFLLSAYEAIANASIRGQTFFQARQGIITRLSAAGLSIEENGEAIADFDYGQQLFGSLELLGQYALVKNWDRIAQDMLSDSEVEALGKDALLELLRARDPDAYAQYEAGTLSEENALARGRELEGEIAGALAAGAEERYIGTLVNLARRIEPGTAFFLFNNALPAIAAESESAEDFLGLANKVEMALTQISSSNSPYHLYGVQDVANSYLYVQVERELKAGTGPSQEALDLILRETNEFPGVVINFENAPNLGVEATLAGVGPLRQFNYMRRRYVDWGYGRATREFENLPLRLGAFPFPPSMQFGARFNSIDYLIPATLGFGSMNDSQAAVQALAAALDPEALFSPTEMSRFMGSQYAAIVQMFEPMPGLSVRYHPNVRPAYYRALDLESRLARIELGLAPLIPEAVWSPRRWSIDFGGTYQRFGEEDRGIGAARAQAEGPTAGGAVAAREYHAGEAGNEMAAGELHMPRLQAAVAQQAAWAEEETEEAVLARLNGMGEDSDYAVLFDSSARQKEGEDAYVIRAYSYTRIGGHWFRLGFYDIEGDRETLDRFAQSLSGMGPILMGGYKYGETEGLVAVNAASDVNDMEDFAGLSLAFRMDDINNTLKSLLGSATFTELQNNSLISGGFGFLFAPGFTLGLLGRGAVLAEGPNGYGAEIMLDYNKNNLRLAGTAGLDFNPVTYVVNNNGNLSVRSYEGTYLSGSLNARYIISEAEKFDAIIRGYVQVGELPEGQEARPAGMELGGRYSGENISVGVSGSYAQAAGAEGTERMGGGAAVISFKVDDREWEVSLGGQYSTDRLIDGRRVLYDQGPIVERLLENWQEYNAAEDAGERARALFQAGQALRALAIIRSMSGGGLESLREASDLLFAASVMTEGAEWGLALSGVASRGAFGMEGEGEYGGGAGGRFTYRWGRPGEGGSLSFERNSITVSGNLGTSPAGELIGDLSLYGSGRSFWAGGVFSKSVWEEYGLKGMIGWEMNGVNIGFQGSGLWGGTQGVNYVWNAGAYVGGRSQEGTDWRVAANVGAFDIQQQLANETEESFTAYTVGAMVEIARPSWSLLLGTSIIPYGDITGFAANAEYSYRDISSILDAVGVRAEARLLGNEWYVTFTGVFRNF